MDLHFMLELFASMFQRPKLRLAEVSPCLLTIVMFSCDDEEEGEEDQHDEDGEEEEEEEEVGRTKLGNVWRRQRKMVGKGGWSNTRFYYRILYLLSYASLVCPPL